MNKKEIANLLIRHEGYRQFPYTCTAGRITIAIGRNIQDKGITREEAIYLLDNDITECHLDLLDIFPYFDEYPENVQTVMVNMRFQLGPNRFRKFTEMIKAVKNKNMEQVIREMKDSLWYKKQTQNRANELIGMLR